jgi:uncharacterized SAM-binding protein YcdF (DUF218 family)
MFFILSKLFVFLLKPLNWVIGLLLFSLISKNKNGRKRSRWAAFGMLLFFSNPLIINQLLLKCEVSPRPISSLRDTFDVGILLGGYSCFETQTPIDMQPFSAAANRCTQTFELYKKGNIRKILLSGGEGNLYGIGDNEAERVAEYLQRLGVPSADILVENASRNTHENALFSKNLIDKKCPNGSFLLLTSAWHLPRAKGCFDKVGLKTTIFPVDFWGKTFRFTPKQSIEPDPEAFQKWDFLIKEGIGLIVYRLKNYI